MRLLKLPALFLLFICSFHLLPAQTNPEAIVLKNIRSVRLHNYGDQHGLPVHKLGSTDRLELHFDDMDANVKSYYYTYQLCDYNWNPVRLSPFDYIKGFTQRQGGG